jgi:hypothetical protein
MMYFNETFYYVEVEDIDGPFLAFGCRIEGKDEDHLVISVDVSPEGDRTYVYEVEKLLEESLTMVKVKTSNHGILKLKRLEYKEYRKMKKFHPTLFSAPWKEVKGKNIGYIKV